MSEATIAAVALVVSLIALIIAVLQLCQHLFGTAEGWRRCDFLVIGPSARLRRSQFRWDELRYETRYTTPEIMLTTGEADPAPPLPTKVRFVNFVKNYRDSYTLLDPGEPEEIRETINPAQDHTDSRINHWRSYTHNDPLQDFAEKGQSSGIHRRYSRYEGENSDLFVSWIPLIREIAGVWAEYKRLGCLYKRDGSRHQDERRRTTTYVEIRFHEHSWDMMPPDVIRPLAFIRMNHLVVLVLRLGMRWIDLGRGTLRAVGDRGTLTSTNVPGLGRVVQFNFNSKPNRSTREIIPSAAVDKMMFGIIPGCEKLHTENSALIDDDGKPGLLLNVLKKLGVSASASGKIMEAANNKESYRRNDIPHWKRGRQYHPAMYDMVHLLSPFMPVHDCTATEILCPIPTNQGRFARTPFHF